MAPALLLAGLMVEGQYIVMVTTRDNALPALIFTVQTLQAHELFRKHQIYIVWWLRSSYY